MFCIECETSPKGSCLNTDSQLAMLFGEVVEPHTGIHPFISKCGRPNVLRSIGACQTYLSEGKPGGQKQITRNLWVIAWPCSNGASVSCLLHKCDQLANHPPRPESHLLLPHPPWRYELKQSFLLLHCFSSGVWLQRKAPDTWIPKSYL